MKLKVVLNETEEVDLNKIDRFNSLSQSTSDASSVTYGPLSGSGTLSVIDTDGSIKNLVEDGVLNSSNMKVDVYFNDKKIRTHYTRDSSYDENGMSFDIDLSDKINELSNRKFSGYFVSSAEKTAYELLYIIMNEYSPISKNDFNNMLNSNIIYGKSNKFGTVYDYLNSVTVQYPIIESNQTFNDVISQICSTLQLRLFVDCNGSFKFVSGRPIDSLEEYIEINNKHIFSDFKKDVVLKNKYDGVEVSCIEYNRVSKKLKVPQLLSYVFKDKEAIDEYVENMSFWQSNFYRSMDEIINDNSLVIEDRGDWVICVDSVLVDGFVNVSKTLKDGEYKGLMAIMPNSDPVQVGDVYSYGYGGTPYDLSVFSSTDKFYEFIKTNEPGWEYFVAAGFLINDIYGEYVSEYKPMFAFKKSGSYYYPFQISFTTDVLNNNDSSVAYTIQRNDKTYSFGGSNNVCSIGGVLSNYKLENDYMQNIVASNILNDYSKGIKTANVTIAPITYNNNNGEKTLDGNYGETIKVCDIVGVSGQKYNSGEVINWKVCGSNFRYDGEPLQELEIEEAKRPQWITDVRFNYLFDKIVNKYYVSAKNNNISGSIYIGGQYNDGTNGQKEIYMVDNRGFEKCSLLNKIVIKDTITDIKQSAFSECSGVSELVIGKNVGFIGNRSFYGMNNLKKITLNSINASSAFSSTYKDSDMFYDAGKDSSGIDLIIGDSVKKIPSYMFCPNSYSGESHFPKITSIRIKGEFNLSEIGEYAFSGCNHISDIYYAGTQQEWQKINIGAGNEPIFNSKIHYNWRGN